MTVLLLLAVIVILLFTRQADRDYTIGIALLIGAFTWLALEIHLLRVLAAIVAVALAHWTEIVMAFGGAILLIVPAIMLYIALRDEIEKAATRKFRESAKGHPSS